MKIRLFIGEAKGIDNGHRSKVKGQRSKVKGQRSKMIALKKLNTEKMEKKKKKEKRKKIKHKFTEKIQR